MPRKAKAKAAEEEVLEDDSTEVNMNPYEVLGIETKAGIALSADASEIKSAYRKAALKHHPDKASPENKDHAHRQFQLVATSYAILSDPRRKKRFDLTGCVPEALALDDDDDFDWTEFWRDQMEAMVDGEMIDKIKQEYQESTEEREDVLRAYEEYQGDMDAVYEEIMCSNVLDDDERFRSIIDNAIKDGEVDEYKSYKKESKAKKRQRVENAKTEEKEAMELAEELGVKEKLFGKGSGAKGKKGKGGDESALMALIQQRQKGRADNFFDNLEEKYGGFGSAGKKGKRKDIDEPSEEMFQKNAKKAKAKSKNT